MDILPQNDQLSLKELKENLRNVLRNTGSMNSVKAQIRKQFVSTIIGNNKSKREDYEVKRHLSGRCHEWYRHDHIGDLHNRVVFSLIYHSLYRRKLTNTLSVLIAEYDGGYDIKSYVLSEIDILVILKLGKSTEVYKRIMDHELASPDDLDGIPSLLDYLTHYTFTAINSKSEVSIQTDDSSFSATDIVDMQLKDIRNHYMKLREDERMNPVKSVEERMIAFERECTERSRRDLEIQLAYIRENEFTKIRLEERQKARLELEIARKEMENDFKLKLESYKQREMDLNRRAEEKERHFQLTLYDARQKMQQEIDDIRNEERVISRKLEIESQGLHMLELRIKESQATLTQRENDVARREKEAAESIRNLESKAKKEAKDFIRTEMESIAFERSSLISDRQRFEDEKSFHSALIENANIVKAQLRELQAQLEERDDELARYKRRLEKSHSSSMSTPENFENIGYSANMITLIQRNAELEARLKERDDRTSLRANEEIQKLALRLKEVELQGDSDRRNLSREKELFQQELQNERNICQALKQKFQESEKKIEEYKSLLTRLQSSHRRNGTGGSTDIDHAKRISDMVGDALSRPMTKTVSSRNQNYSPSKYSHSQTLENSLRADLSSYNQPFAVNSQQPFGINSPMMPYFQSPLLMSAYAQFPQHQQQIYPNAYTIPSGYVPYVPPNTLTVLPQQSRQGQHRPTEELPRHLSDRVNKTVTTANATANIASISPAKPSRFDYIQNTDQRPDITAFHLNDQFTSFDGKSKLVTGNNSSPQSNVAPTDRRTDVPIFIQSTECLFPTVSDSSVDKYDSERYRAHAYNTSSDGGSSKRPLTENDTALEVKADIDNMSSVKEGIHRNSRAETQSTIGNYQLSNSDVIPENMASTTGIGDQRAANIAFNDVEPTLPSENPKFTLSPQKRASDQISYDITSSKVAGDDLRSSPPLVSINHMSLDSIGQVTTINRDDNEDKVGNDERERPPVREVESKEDEEEKKLEDDRRKILEARQRVIDRRNRRSTSSVNSFDSNTDVLTSIDDRPLVASISSFTNVYEPSTKPTTQHQGPNKILTSQDDEDDGEKSSDLEYETAKPDEVNDDESYDGWF